MRPLAIAHRGEPFGCRENTLPAFEAAVSLRADMVEIDVRRTADGAVAVVHDPTLDRLWGIDRLVSPSRRAGEVRELGIPELARGARSDGDPVQ